MKMRLTVRLGAMVIAALTISMATVAVAETFPPAGVDVIESGAVHRIQMLPEYGGMILDGHLYGTVTVSRSDPYEYTGGGGQEAIDTVMTSMNMTGTVGGYPAQMMLQGPPPESPGMIIDKNPDPGDSFPADSFFDIFFQITVQDTPFGTLALHNNDPLRMASTITAIPPNLGQTPYFGTGWIPVGQYVPRNPEAELEDLPLVLYNPLDEPVAKLISATHPEPGTLGLLALGSLALLKRSRR